MARKPSPKEREREREWERLAFRQGNGAAQGSGIVGSHDDRGPRVGEGQGGRGGVKGAGGEGAGGEPESKTGAEEVTSRPETSNRKTEIENDPKLHF